MNKELSFFLKVIRNGLILASGFFVSVWAVGDLTWMLCKPVVIFFIGYVFTELTRHYGIKTPMNQNKTTIIFN